MRTAVVILNWNTKDYLRRFLPPLLDSLKGLDAGVVVADNASGDGSRELLEEEFPDVTRIEFDENLGFTGGYDKAVAHALVCPALQLAVEAPAIQVAQMQALSHPEILVGGQ